MQIMKHLSKSNVETFTLVDLLRNQAILKPDLDAYTFLENEHEVNKLTYAGMDRRARAIGALLQEHAKQGERALLLYPPGLEFVAAFFGCLYAGVIAVPVYPPNPSRLDRTLPRLLAIMNDSQPIIALTTSSILPMAEYMFAQEAEFKSIRWLATDSIKDDLAKDWKEPEIDSSTLAFLQYTSGSTAMPRGVMVSQGNLLHNERMIQKAFWQSEQSIVVSWLPLYHDMGLIGGALQPLYNGGKCILMSPVTFLKKPFRWLQAISDYKATTSGAPNFAYDLCVRKITAEQRDTLDLSSWVTAFNGAEPISYETLERFATAFEPCGFKLGTFFPCYGLAEATLLVACGLKRPAPVLCIVDAEALGKNMVVSATPGADGTRTLVSCGKTELDQKVTIVDPETLTECSSEKVGEIWVSGPSIAQGYWNRTVSTVQTFQAYLTDTGEGPYLRTGDLGFIRDSELFVTGRLKDLVIIRGKNHYPQDIEWTVEKSDPLIRPGCCAAFSVDINDKEHLVVVAEVDDRRQSDQPQSFEALDGIIKRAVARDHELHVHAVVLLKNGGIPKTSSGKVQRHACKIGFLEGNLEVVDQK
jgi:acyl-CoA synthetase (AMP-forming)/AMP-acid ligase II